MTFDRPAQASRPEPVQLVNATQRKSSQLPLQFENTSPELAAGTNLLFRPVNPELDRLKARKGKDAQLPVSDSASVKSGLDGDMSVAGDLEEGGIGKVGKHAVTLRDVQESCVWAEWRRVGGRVLEEGGVGKVGSHWATLGDV